MASGSFNGWNGFMGYAHVDGKFVIDEYINPARKGKLVPLKLSIAVAKNTVYLENCSECHMGYSAGLLPARSWEVLLTSKNLEDHFGEYVFLEENAREVISKYLVKGAAEQSAKNYQLSKQILRSVKSIDTPLRISKIDYVYKNHKDISDEYTILNPRVVSLSQCTACHQQADCGIYNKKDVYIPDPLVLANGLDCPSC